VLKLKHTTKRKKEWIVNRGITRFVILFRSYKRKP
jgi:hypothetical protein